MHAATAIVLGLLSTAALASPDDICSVKLDPQGEMICSTPPPPGTGLGANGRGAVHFPKSGFYEFRGGLVGSTTGMQWRMGGSYSWVEMQRSGPLEWIRPDGKREVVPTVYLYPPF